MNGTSNPWFPLSDWQFQAVIKLQELSFPVFPWGVPIGELGITPCWVGGAGEEDGFTELYILHQTAGSFNFSIFLFTSQSLLSFFRKVKFILWNSQDPEGFDSVMFMILLRVLGNGASFLHMESYFNPNQKKKDLSVCGDQGWVLCYRNFPFQTQTTYSSMWAKKGRERLQEGLKK